MTQRMPRNQALHERRHHRKAGPHGPACDLTSLRSALLFLDEEYGPDAVNLIINDIRRDRELERARSTEGEER